MNNIIQFLYFAIRNQVDFLEDFGFKRRQTHIYHLLFVMEIKLSINIKQEIIFDNQAVSLAKTKEITSLFIYFVNPAITKD